MVTLPPFAGDDCSLLQTDWLRNNFIILKQTKEEKDFNEE